jgi:hypothetical protein
MPNLEESRRGLATQTRRRLAALNLPSQIKDLTTTETLPIERNSGTSDGVVDEALHEKGPIPFESGPISHLSETIS